MDYISNFVRENGIPPTYAEMADGLGIKSRGSTHRMVKSLCEAGYLKMIPGKFRTIQVCAPYAPTHTQNQATTQ
jgi:repressor LexA